jgi:hypothetical protein
MPPAIEFPDRAVRLHPGPLPADIQSWAVLERKGGPGRETQVSECDCLAGCPFFNDRMKDMEGSASLFKNRYCTGDFMKCARHQVKDALGKPAVPVDLYPNMQERAQQIIAAPR